MSAREKKTILLEYLPDIESKLTAYECNQILNAMEDYAIDFKLNGNLNEPCEGKKQVSTESKCNKQNVINWAFYPEETPSYGDEIILQYPPEQCRTMPKIVTVYDKDTELIDGCKWALITPCL